MPGLSVVTTPYPYHGTMRPGVVGGHWNGGFAWGGYRGGFGRVTSGSSVLTGRPGMGGYGFGAISAETRGAWNTQALATVGDAPLFPNESKEWLKWDARRLYALSAIKAAEAAAIAATGKTIGGDAAAGTDGILLLTEAAMHANRARDQQSAAGRAQTVAQLRAAAVPTPPTGPGPGVTPGFPGLPQVNLTTLALVGGGILALKFLL